jgi:hypothetical protein
MRMPNMPKGEWRISTDTRHEGYFHWAFNQVIKLHHSIISADILRRSSSCCTYCIIPWFGTANGLLHIWYRPKIGFLLHCLFLVLQFKHVLLKSWKETNGNQFHQVQVRGTWAEHKMQMFLTIKWRTSNPLGIVNSKLARKSIIQKYPQVSFWLSSACSM